VVANCAVAGGGDENVESNAVCDTTRVDGGELRACEDDAVTREEDEEDDCFCFSICNRIYKFVKPNQ